MQESYGSESVLYVRVNGLLVALGEVRVNKISPRDVQLRVKRAIPSPVGRRLTLILQSSRAGPTSTI